MSVYNSSFHNLNKQASRCADAALSPSGSCYLVLCHPQKTSAAYNVRGPRVTSQRAGFHHSACPIRAFMKKGTKGKSNKGWTFLISVHLADAGRYGTSKLKSESQCRPLPSDSDSTTGMQRIDKSADHDFHFYGNLSLFH